MVRIHSTLNINTDACVVLTRKLEQMHRSALPVAIRQTLNAAAFDVKKNTLPNSASKNFIKRSPNFFKTFSKVNKATGFNTKTMQAVVGMSDNGKGKAAETAVGNMGIQEEGGVIDHGFSYLKATRGGHTVKGVVRRTNYYDHSKVISGKSNQKRGRGTVKSKFVARAFRSLKEKKPMFFNSIKGNYLMRVTSIRRKKNGKVKIASQLLMKERSDKPAKIKATHFSKEAAVATIKKIEGFYIIEAKKQIERIVRSR